MRFGRGFGEVNLSQMRGFYLGHREILQTASEKSLPAAIALQGAQAASEEFLGSVAHYALEGLPNKVMAAEYRTVLPKEPFLVAEIEKTIHAIETRHSAGSRKSTARKKR